MLERPDAGDAGKDAGEVCEDAEDVGGMLATVWGDLHGIYSVF